MATMLCLLLNFNSKVVVANLWTANFWWAGVLLQAAREFPYLRNRKRESPVSFLSSVINAMVN